MICLSILAGGRATRMFGPGGGCKPLIQVGQNDKLIDYLIRETTGLNFDSAFAVVPERDGHGVSAYLAERLAAPFIAIPSKPTGTGDAVRSLLAASQADMYVLTTCDIYGEKGDLQSFIHTSLEKLSSLEYSKAAMCAIAIAPVPVGDERPIYVHAKENGIVRSYGKDVSPSPYSFASVRVLNLAFAQLMLDLPPIGTDTDMMSAVLEISPGSIVAAVYPTLFDVDDAHALNRAATIAGGALHP